MELKVITDPKEIEKARDRFKNTLQEGTSQKLSRTIGWHGGSKKVDVYWWDKVGFWAGFVDHERGDYWSAFGTSDPTDRKNLTITCEVNVPFEGIDRRVAGVFACDDTGKIFIGHNGKIGGGRKGIGKDLFWKNYRGPEAVNVCFPDGVELEMALIGHVDGKSLPEQMAHFIHEVERIKSIVMSKESTAQVESKINIGYNPEFSGKRNVYPLGKTVEATCYHGLVVDALVRQIKKRGLLQFGNDQSRDLYILDKSGCVRCLFEVKTDLSTSSVYSAIGQLMFHTAEYQKMPPTRIMVLPGQPNEKTKDILTRLNIRIIPYSLISGEVQLEELEEGGVLNLC